LIDLHKNRLYKLCLYLEKQTYEADELFQDTWVKAIEKMHQYDQSQPFYPWLSKIAVNIYRDRLRRIKKEFQYAIFSNEEELLKVPSHTDLLNEVIVRQEWEVAKEALKGLEDKYKLPMVLTLIEGLSYQETSEILDVPEKTIKSRVYDGRIKLKRIMEKEGGEKCCQRKNNGMKSCAVKR
jgi:RNA polymerase sigma-70 factor (ECF subfamily)